MTTPTLSQRLTAYALISGGLGVITTGLLPDWWLSSSVLLVIACLLLVASIATEEE